MGHDTHLFEEGDLVALKVFRSQRAAIFQNELTAYEKLDHPNIIKCFGFYKDLPYVDDLGREH